VVLSNFLGAIAFLYFTVAIVEAPPIRFVERWVTGQRYGRVDTTHRSAPIGLQVGRFGVVVISRRCGLLVVDNSALGLGGGGVIPRRIGLLIDDLAAVASARFPAR
jgi:hypothetical protein